ncbi:MAG: DUF3299 domain-containing protein [Idiomarina sp.]|nr:DUF3299 domain-containing protein [Idiomarina sp.]
MKYLGRALAFWLMVCSVSTTAVAGQLPRTIDWIDLIPDHIMTQLDALPQLEHDYSESAPDPFTDEWDHPAAAQWNAILNSTDTVSDYEGKLVRLPGYIVPLDYDDRQNVRSFFFVPYYGACIHVPPPPPYQLIYIHEVPRGTNISVNDMYYPYWITGVLRIDIEENELGTAAYAMELRSMRRYQPGD